MSDNLILFVLTVEAILAIVFALVVGPFRLVARAWRALA